MRLERTTVFRVSIVIFLIISLSIANVTDVVGTNFEIGEIQFSPDGHFIAGVGPRAVRIWDASGGLLFEENLDIFYEDMAWSPDSSSVVTASDDLLVKIWNVSDPNYPTGTLLSSFNPFHESLFLTSVDWSPTGSYLAIGAEFQAPIQIWNALNFTYVESIGGGFNAGNIEWSPNEEFIALTWYRREYGPPYAIPTRSSPESGSYILCNGCLEDNASAIAWNSDGSRLAIGYDNGAVNIIDVVTNNAVVSFHSGDFVASLSWSFDDQLLVTPHSIHFAETGYLAKQISYPTYSVDFHPYTYEIAYLNNASEELIIEDVSYLIRD